MSKTNSILKHPEDINKLDTDTLNLEIEKGYQDMLAGSVIPAKQAFENIRKRYGLATSDTKS